MEEEEERVDVDFGGRVVEWGGERGVWSESSSEVIDIVVMAFL